MTRNMLQATAAFVNATGGTNSDNPTELTRSDVDEVIRTLVSNNSYTIADNIEGEDRFKIPDLYKFSLIDLEFYGESYEDRGQAEAEMLLAA